jgi:U32 family peptidase
VCLKVEGRKKKPEYVATVTQSYREFLNRLERGEEVPPSAADVEPLVQIFSRGFTGGMYGGREGREYVTRTQPDNRGMAIGSVVGWEKGDLIVDVSIALHVGDGLGFEPSGNIGGPTTGFSVSGVRTLWSRGGTIRQAIETRTRVDAGWTVVRTSEAKLLEKARASFASMSSEIRAKKTRLDVRLFGAAGTPLKAVFVGDGETVTVRSDMTLSIASKRPLDVAKLRDQFGRLGDTPFILGSLDVTALGTELFLPVSEQNHLRQQAVEQLLLRRDWAGESRAVERRATIEAAISAIPRTSRSVHRDVARVSDDATPFMLSAQVYNVDDADVAATAGATEICFDPFLRHPAPPVSRVRALAANLASRGVSFRIRTPTIVRPEDRKSIQKWLDLDVPVLSGHLGLVAELGRADRDVSGDYALNVFNSHTAAEIFALGAKRITASVELTTDELSQLVAPWDGEGFDVFLYGRPEGMTLEHCVLSAAFDREVTTCRDLCVQKHTNVQLTDPTGYTFPVATDSACRNRLLHSRPVEGSEFLPKLWRTGIRGFALVFNVPGDDVGAIVRGYRDALDALSGGVRADVDAIRRTVGAEFTRGHFARAV